MFTTRLLSCGGDQETGERDGRVLSNINCKFRSFTNALLFVPDPIGPAGPATGRDGQERAI